MKKSEIYKKAMASVIRDDCWCMETKLQMLEALMEDKSLAEYSEKCEAERASKEAAKNETL